MLLSHEPSEVVSSSSSECPSSPVATPTLFPDLKKPTRDMSFQDVDDVFEDNIRRAVRLREMSRQTSISQTPQESRSSTTTIILRTMVILAIVLLPLAICLHLKFATPWYRGARVDIDFLFGRDPTLGWSHKPVVSPSCRVARKYTINPGSPAAASWVLDCEVPGFGATLDANHHRIVDALKVLSHIPDQLCQAQAMVHWFHRDLGTLAIKYEFPISPESISASTMDLLIDAMASYYIHVHRMFCHIRDASTETLDSEARMAPFILTWYNNKIYHDVEESISVLETVETIIRGRHTECHEIMWKSYMSMPSDIVLSHAEWDLTTELHNILDEALSLLDQIDEAIKTATAILKAVEREMIVVDSDSEGVHRVNHAQISNLLVDVEETSKLSSDLVARMEHLWRNSTFNK